MQDILLTNLEKIYKYIKSQSAFSPYETTRGVLLDYAMAVAFAELKSKDLN